MKQVNVDKGGTIKKSEGPASDGRADIDAAYTKFIEVVMDSEGDWIEMVVGDDQHLGNSYYKASRAYTRKFLDLKTSQVGDKRILYGRMKT